MKIIMKITVTESKVIDKDIELPYFFKNKLTDTFVKIENENKVITVNSLKSFFGISIHSLLPSVLTDLEEGRPCSELEFELAKGKALEFIIREV